LEGLTRLVGATPEAATPPAHSRRRWFKFWAALFGLSLVLVLLVLGEIAGRLVMWARHGVPGKSYGIYQPDPELGATHRPNSYNSNSSINNWGLRNLDDFSENKPPGSTRIYCSGGSTTFCYNLTTAEAWPLVLQTKLRQMPGHERDEVLNAGQICFSIADELALARRLLPKLRPDVVVIYSGINEGMAATSMDLAEPGVLDRLLREQRWAVPTRNLAQTSFWMQNSVLRRFLEYRVNRWLAQQFPARPRPPTKPRSEKGPDTHPYVRENFGQTLRLYLAFIRAQGAVPVVVAHGDNGSRPRDKPHDLRNFAVEIAQAEGVIVCDFEPVFVQHPRRRECFIDSGVHVTREGADAVAQELQRVILVALAGQTARAP
jgi:lysophospholipase L1-like esterase